MKNLPYKKVWDYLEGKLSSEEEAELLELIHASDRNFEFFHEVVNDFNHAKYGRRPEIIETKKSRAILKLGIAASLLLMVAITAIWSFNKESEQPIVELEVNKVLILRSSSPIALNQAQFNRSGIIQIEQGVSFEPKSGTSYSITLETKNGYYSLIDAKGEIKLDPIKGDQIYLENGKAEFISKETPIKSFEVHSGDQLSFNAQTNTFIKSSKKPTI